jgi:glutamine amidotransferase
VRIAIVDCGSGNLASVTQALARAAERESIDVSLDVTDSPSVLAAADRIVLPGQGAFATCAQGIAAASGLREALETATEGGTPFLGICVGMQLMARSGLEHRVTEGFGWIEGEIALLEAPSLRLPQMGWNSLDFRPESHPLLKGVDPGDHVYFVHSYGLRGYDEAELIATTSYGGKIPALVARGNRAGTQFHVEKSQEVGLRILANFLRWSPDGSPAA